MCYMCYQMCYMCYQMCYMCYRCATDVLQWRPRAIKGGGESAEGTVPHSYRAAPPLASTPPPPLEMAASSIIPQHFASYTPPGEYPTVRAANGSGPTFISLAAGFSDLPPTLYIRGDVGVPFVQPATFGDKDTQDALREKFSAGEKLKVVTYFTPLDSDKEKFHHFAETLNRWANALVKEKFSKQSKNSRFQPCSVVRPDDGSIKMALDKEVLANLQLSTGSETPWNYPRGVYDLVFQINGMWVSPQGCGYIFKARRLALVETRAYSMASVDPDCFAFGTEYATKTEAEEGENNTPVHKRRCNAKRLLLEDDE